MSDASQWLLLDVGNTAIKWRLGDASALGGASGAAATLDDLVAGLPAPSWCEVAISSVAGAPADAALTQALQDLKAVPVWQAESTAEFQGLVNSYATPQTMGVDRWLAMVAARHNYAESLCVIDLGTAVTVDLVSQDGHHQGGFILPGPALMQRALSADTGRIRVSAPPMPDLTPGNSTEACVGAGVWRAAIGALTSCLASYPEYRPVLTGGGAAAAIALGIEGQHRPDLVLEGLRLWLAQQLDARES